MTTITTPTEQNATGDAAAIYAESIASDGFVADHTKVMAMNPEAYRAWQSLIKAIAGPMDKRRYELVTLAAAQGIRSQHCRLAHGEKTLRYVPEEELVRIARDYRDAGLSEAEVAMMEFAEKVSTASSEMTDADSARLREVGFSDREIVDIALAAAARNYYSRAIQALGAAVETPTALSEELRVALVGTL